MFKKLTTINNKNLKEFERLYDDVQFTDYPLRIGVNGVNRPSYYYFSRKWDWKKSQRDTFKSLFPYNYADYAISGYFINFPAKTGRLDLQDYWVGSRMAGNMISYSLTDNVMYINNEKILVSKGEGITFSLREYHEVKPLSYDQKWACIMTLKSFI